MKTVAYIKFQDLGWTEIGNTLFWLKILLHLPNEVIRSGKNDFPIYIRPNLYAKLYLAPLGTFTNLSSDSPLQGSRTRHCLPSLHSLHWSCLKCNINTSLVECTCHLPTPCPQKANQKRPEALITTDQSPGPLWSGSPLRASCWPTHHHNANPPPRPTAVPLRIQQACRRRSLNGTPPHPPAPRLPRHLRQERIQPHHPSSDPGQAVPVECAWVKLQVGSLSS